MQKRLIIFDLDGTLLDTIGDLAGAVNRALARLGYPTHPREAYRFMVGSGIMALFERALPEQERSEENKLRVKELFVPWYDLHNADLTCPYEGIVELLNTLSERGVSLAVASNKYQSATEKLVGHYFPTTPFCAVLGQREGVAVKPSPAIVWDAMRLAGVENKSEVLYVGDSDVDMLTGHNAGVDVVGVSWGFRPREELAAHAPKAIIDSPAELLGLLE